jgi:site-specific recombinase XerD
MRQVLFLSGFEQRPQDFHRWRCYRFAARENWRMELKFRELVEASLADKKLRLAPRSWKTDKQRAAEIIFEFGELQPTDVTPARIEVFLAKVKTRASGPTSNRHRSLLSSIFAFGRRRGLVAANPLSSVPRFREHENRSRFLEADEEGALRTAVGPREPEVVLAMYTGIRRGEQYSLKWESVSLNAGILTVNGKTGQRTVPINPEARSAILCLHRASRGSSFVCPGTQRHWFEAAVRRAGLGDFRWHDLRHTFASRLVMEGVDIRSVQKLLGHRSIVTTQRYAHVSDEHLRLAVEKLARKAEPQLVLFATHGNGL